MTIWGHHNADRTEAAVFAHVYRNTPEGFGQSMYVAVFQGEPEYLVDAVSGWVESGGRELLYSFSVRALEAQASVMGFTLAFPEVAPESEFSIHEIEATEPTSDTESV